MADHSRPVNKIIVLGSTGNVGVAAVNALAAHPADFTITAVTRDKSKAKFPSKVLVVESDLSKSSLQSLFRNQDAVVSCLATFAVEQQRDIVDTALKAGVARFIPSEYGLDYTGPDAIDWFPVIKPKVENLNYLRQFQNQMSWTTFVVGSFFDLKFQGPEIFGFDMAANKVTIFDGGNVEFEASTLSRIGEAIAAALSPGHLSDTANQVVFVNSFTTTQNEIVAALQNITKRRLEVEHDTTAAFRKRALKALEDDPEDWKPVGDLITASVYGQGDLNQYSKSPGLWNERLGLGKEDLVESMEKALGV
ncbi:hypothetical protein M409DRAFT_50969 [Zasmidium cellare ATCC 36951]|uniref:NmrA-like domain-containing protein n=1 Tax=Zasmidium cellare ATCC 36951 TaxID=1080233 RepID=A0A6A6CZF9_ZASCE|nr:uncharacterized protein M409DRAFT_50969 [Zasmidium cellare ATCC 36951]KAF2171548.1 hypothetical protein M409DRAFT_50969 [Zasmidium cellare ATCC 36951]